MIASVKKVSKGGVGVGEEEMGLRVVVLVPTMSTGLTPAVVCSITDVLEAPEPRMRGVLGKRV